MLSRSIPRAFLLITALFVYEGLSQLPSVLSRSEHEQIKAFDKKTKAYIKLREKLRKRTPAVKKDATPEEVDAYKASLQVAISTARARAKQGDIFTPEIAHLIKRLTKAQFTDFEKSELRKTVLEADTKGVPLKVNAAYPEAKELVQMPPPLLLTLPQLPKELRYRFVGRALVLMDREASLIIDILRDTLP